MVRINFYLRLPDKKGNANIHLFLSYGKNERVVFPTGKSIHPNFWNSKSQRAKEGLGNPIGKALNFWLDRLQQITLEIIHDPDIAKDKDSIKNEIKQRINRQEEPDKTITLPSVFREHKERNASFKPALSMIKDFDEFSRSYGRLTMDKINLEFERKYTAYLEKKGLTVNTIGKYIKNIKTALNGAVKEGYDIPLHFKYFKVSQEDVYNIYLNTDELKVIENLEFNNKEGYLERARDLFLVGCYTGLRFNDFSRLDPKKHIINNTIHILTGNENGNKSKNVIIPIHPVVRNIMDKYDNSLPHSISNQKLNDYIKLVGKKAELNQKITKWRTEGGLRKEYTLEKWEMITSHTARRSFATNAFLAGVPEKIIMDITGHTTTKAFHKYIKITKQQAASILSQHPFFIG